MDNSSDFRDFWYDTTVFGNCKGEKTGGGGRLGSLRIQFVAKAIFSCFPLPFIAKVCYNLRYFAMCRRRDNL